MSRPQEPHRAFFPFGNPFRMISPKGSQLSPKLLQLLNSFEETLAQRMIKLNPTNKSDIFSLFSLSWMKLAMESISETYNDIKALISNLDLPVCDWDEKWIDVYLDISVKLLDICNAFNSELSRLNQGQLFLKCAMHNLESPPSKQLARACSSVDGFRKHIHTKNPRLDKCWTILDSLVESLDLPKVKNSAKGKILMRAMYGVKVEIVFVYSVFTAVFSGSAEKLFNLNVSETYLWAQAFMDLQTSVNKEIRNTSNRKPIALTELEAVDVTLKRLYPMIQEGSASDHEDVFQNSVTELRTVGDSFSGGIELLTKEVDGFFEIVLSGRDALLSNLRADGSKIEPKKMQTQTGNVGQVVR
ncbi:protein BPS1, chloroplastic [Cannabis sativa]|uniref:protein BPS1, chloroplastic n=1 Tax=Cannabis sativa TaxID=3483 RepID=UPI0029CA82F3|nr:protein BPS1, chloroplastic [Cannabis sativa]